MAPLKCAFWYRRTNTTQLAYSGWGSSVQKRQCTLEFDGQFGSWPAVRRARFGGQANEGSRTQYQHCGESGCGRGRNGSNAFVGTKDFSNPCVFAEVPDIVHHLPQQLSRTERLWRGFQEERFQVPEG